MAEGAGSCCAPAIRSGNCKVGHPVCLQEVRESRDETLGLPYGDGAAPCSGQLSRPLLTGW